MFDNPANPLPHLLVVVLVIFCTTALALDHSLNDAVVGLFGAAIGGSGTALAVQRHIGQTSAAVDTALTASNGKNGHE